MATSTAWVATTADAAPVVRLGDGLAGRANALNTLRLVFAVVVIGSHSWLLTGHREPTYAGITAGTWAVAGFFAISGHLVATARLRTDLPTFLFRRARRIFPAYWACCAVIAFLLAPWAALLNGSSYDLRAAVGYVVGNLTTSQQQLTIGPETAGRPWNGSAWTLLFELLCYLAVGAVLTLDVVRRHQTGVAVASYTLSAAAFWYCATHDRALGLAWLAALFAAGWVVSTLRRRLVATPLTTVGALGLAVGTTLVDPAYTAFAALPLAYAVLSAGALLPVGWFTTHDVSYGTYLYGWPVQQLLLLLLPVHSLGVLLPTSVALSLAAGAASWLLLERRCLGRRG